jgi:hypothetical protein
MGMTPIGFVRVYPERVGERLVKYQAGLLTEDKETSWFVRELFRRYATGNWSLRALSEWANNDPACPKPFKSPYWQPFNIGYILQNPVYIGNVRFNVNKSGLYESTADGVGFVENGLHAGFVDEGVFERVQVVMGSRTRFGTMTQRDRLAPLGYGLLVCAGCGGNMTALHRAVKTKAGVSKNQYVCGKHAAGIGVCREPSYTMRAGDEALIREVMRLRIARRELTPQTVAEIVGAMDTRDEGAEMRVTLNAALENERAAMKKHVRVLELVGELTDEMVTAFREEGAAISKRMKAIEGQLAALPVAAVNLPAVRDLYTLLSTISLREEIEEARDTRELRDVVGVLVEKAWVVERVPQSRSKWLRMEVHWSQEAAMLLESGLWVLDEQEPSPAQPRTQAEYDKRKNERKKTQRHLHALSDLLAVGAGADRQTGLESTL